MIFFLHLQLPFPALTFCPMTMFSINLDNLEHKRITNQITFDEYDKIKTVMLTTCNVGYGSKSSVINMDDEFYKIIEEISPNNFIGTCIINDIEYKNCSIFFNKFMTDFGICYTFNQLSVYELFYENM